MMKKLIRVFSTAMIAVFLLSGCAQNQKINSLISRFETACQSGDLEAMTECIDPSVIKSIDYVLSAFGADMDTVSAFAAYVLGMDDFFGSDSLYAENRDRLLETLKSFRIRPVKYEYNERKTKCTVTAEFSIETDGERQTEEGEIQCVLKDDEWYITFH